MNRRQTTIGFLATAAVAACGPVVGMASIAGMAPSLEVMNLAVRVSDASIKTVVSIGYSGNVTIEPGLSREEAAHEFWSLLDLKGSDFDEVLRIENHLDGEFSGNVRSDRVVVIITPDGTANFGPRFTADEESREFLRLLARVYPHRRAA